MNAPQRLSPWARRALRFHRCRAEQVRVITVHRNAGAYRTWRVLIVKVPERRGFRNG